MPISTVFASFIIGFFFAHFNGTTGVFGPSFCQEAS
jgi:hypothetical protein